MRFSPLPARDAEAPSCTLTAGASSPRATGLLLSAGWIMDGSALWRGVQSSGCERISPMKMLGCGVADVSHHRSLHAFDRARPGDPECQKGRGGSQLVTLEVGWCCPILLCSVAKPPDSTRSLLLPSSQVSRSVPDSMHACVLSCLFIHPDICEIMLGNLSRLTGCERPEGWTQWHLP